MSGHIGTKPTYQALDELRPAQQKNSIRATLYLFVKNHAYDFSSLFDTVVRGAGVIFIYFISQYLKLRERLTSKIENSKSRIQNSKKESESEKIPLSQDLPNTETEALNSEIPGQTAQASTVTKVTGEITTSQPNSEIQNYRPSLEILPSQEFLKLFKFIQWEVGIILIVVLVQGFFILQGKSITLPGAGATNQKLETVSTLPTNSEPGLRIITDFSVNRGVVDLGYSLKVNKTSIGTKNQSNCQTPLAPAVENGCGFTILPSALGIPARGTIFQSITVEGSFGESKLKVDLKDFEKGVLDADLGAIDSTSFNKKFRLPENIAQSEGIFLRFWTKGEEVTMTKVAIEYANVEMLKPVSGKINPERFKNAQSLVVYQDTDENRIWDSKVDKKWDCRPNFSGVNPIQFDPNGNFVMMRSDSCFVDVKPDNWFTDGGTSVLPRGRWLIVDEVNVVSIPFEVKAEEKATVLDLN